MEAKLDFIPKFHSIPFYCLLIQLVLIPTVGLEGACNRGSCRNNGVLLKRPLVSLGSVLILVEPWNYELPAVDLTCRPKGSLFIR